ncbi:MAG: hypothetical protein WB987_11815 [Candidatus Acidiferrales bacterium]
MNCIRKAAIALTLVLIATPALFAQGFSQYRKFVLGTSLAALSKQIGQDSSGATLVHQVPAVIQSLTYWPIEASSSANRSESVTQILFSFYNGELYRIVVTYDSDAINGLTEEDMVRAISARYGEGTRLYPELALPTYDVYAPAETVIASWEDPQNTVNLFRSGRSTSFGLSVFSKRLNAEADAAIAASIKLEKEQAPQKRIDREKKEVDDLDLARQKNIKSFRP